MTLGNTVTRILVALVTMPLILLVCYLGGWFFVSFILLIGLLSLYEFYQLAAKKFAFSNYIIGSLASAVLIINSFSNLLDYQHLIIIIVVLLVLIELFRNKESAILNLGVSLLGIFYIGLFFSSVVMLREFFKEEYYFGGYLIISIFITIWICDSAAFFFGSAFGKHKLFLRVSPKKSWEGAIAGFIFAIITMVGFKYLFLNLFSIIDAVVVGTIIGSIGQIGDLVESLIKRDSGVKDSSNIIPGHGGVFDRFDSLLLSSPVIYLYISFLK
ncbi:MAG: phosphatidate cytidylyltransferase [Ignavibacteriales bacterium]|nr:phosphatidate cytidylyltransferase [Ignavibacteriales bacterium]